MLFVCGGGGGGGEGASVLAMLGDAFHSACSPICCIPTAPGYFIYAIAVIGKADPTWLNTYKTSVLSLVRDFANPANDDVYFPAMRHKDLWAGHSW